MCVDNARPRWITAAEGIEKLAIVAAVIVAGIWTLFLYYPLRKRDATRAEAEIAKLNIEAARAGTFALDTTVATQVQPGTGRRFAVIVTVTIDNHGSREVGLRSAALEAAIVRGEAAQPADALTRGPLLRPMFRALPFKEFGLDPQKYPFATVNEVDLLPGKQDLVYYFETNLSGTYMVTFAAKVLDPLKGTPRTRGGVVGAISDTRFFRIEEPPVTGKSNKPPVGKAPAA